MFICIFTTCSQNAIYVEQHITKNTKPNTQSVMKNSSKSPSTVFKVKSPDETVDRMQNEKNFAYPPNYTSRARPKHIPHTTYSMHTMHTTSVPSTFGINRFG